MANLWQQIGENLAFVAVSAAIVAALILLAKLAERQLLQLQRTPPAHRVSIIALCAAIAAVLHILDFPLVFLAPEFYKLDFSEVPVMVCGLALGPSAAVVCEGVKILLKLLLKSTSTAFVGDLANFVVGCFYVLPAVTWFHARRRPGALPVGMALGTASMTVLGSLFNAFYLIPKFAQLYGLPLETIISMGAAIRPQITDVYSFAAACVAPLNLVKGGLIALLTIPLYHRLAKTHLFEPKARLIAGNTSQG